MLSDFYLNGKVELHQKKCKCKGTGWIGEPGIAYRSGNCRSRNIGRIRYVDWLQMGKPATLDDALKIPGYGDREKLIDRAPTNQP